MSQWSTFVSGPQPLMSDPHETICGYKGSTCDLTSRETLFYVDIKVFPDRTTSFYSRGGQRKARGPNPAR